MYGMQLEDKSAMICFVNFILALTLAILIRMIIALMKKILKRESKQVSQLKQDCPNTFKYIIDENKIWRKYIDFCIQYFLLCTISEVLFTFTWITPISIVVLMLLYLHQYLSTYFESKAESAKTKIFKLTFSAIIDLKRIILGFVFFSDGKLHFLLLIPCLTLAIEGFIIFFLDFKSKIDKAIFVFNGITTAIICATFALLSDSLSLSINENAITVVLLGFKYALILILSVEIGVITFQNIRDLYRWFKSKNAKTKVMIINLDIAQPSIRESKIGSSPGTPSIKQNSSKSQSNKHARIRFKHDEQSSMKDSSSNINDLEESINELKKKKRISLAKRPEEIKYNDEEACDKDVIIEKISIIQYDTFSSSSKNNSNQSGQNSPSVQSQKPK